MMPDGRLTTVLQHLRQVFDAPEVDGLPDAELLRRFSQRQDQAAFEAVLKRHARMVWGVCRRMLAGLHDAEDAFQATFLVLVHKATKLRRPESLANWLYGVACRVSQAARAQAARCQTLEDEPMAASPADATAQVEGRELRALLDEELDRLPRKYRAPLVLCYLEGKTRLEAAGELGWPEGTVAGRLARARDLLHARLARRGVTLTAAGLTTWVAQTASAAAVPAALLQAVARSAALVTAGKAAGMVSANILALTEGVLKAMSLTRCKSILVTLAVVVLTLGGAGAVWHQAQSCAPAPVEAAALPQKPPAEAPRTPPNKPQPQEQQPPDNALGIAAGDDEKTRKAPPVPLPKDAAAIVISLDYQGGFTLKRVNEEPYLAIRADGKLTVGDPFGLGKRIETKLTPNEVQVLLKFAVHTCKVFEFDRKKAEAEVARLLKGEPLGGPAIVDASDTVIRVKTAERQTEARFNALAYYAQNSAPNVPALWDLHRLERRLDELMKEVLGQGAR